MEDGQEEWKRETNFYHLTRDSKLYKVVDVLPWRQRCAIISFVFEKSSHHLSRATLITAVLAALGKGLTC